MAVMRGKATTGARHVARPVLISLRVSALTENDANSTSLSCPPTSSVSVTVLKALRRDYLEPPVKGKSMSLRSRLVAETIPPPVTEARKKWWMASRNGTH